MLWTNKCLLEKMSYLATVTGALFGAAFSPKNTAPAVMVLASCSGAVVLLIGRPNYRCAIHNVLYTHVIQTVLSKLTITV